MDYMQRLAAIINFDFGENLWRFGPPKVDHLTHMSGSLTPSVISKGPCAAQGVRAVLDAFEGLEFLPQFRHGFLDFDLHLLPRWQQNMPFPKVIAEKDMNGTHYFRNSQYIYNNNNNNNNN